MPEPVPLNEAWTIWHLLIVIGVVTVLVFGRGHLGK